MDALRKLIVSQNTNQLDRKLSEQDTAVEGV